MHFRIKRIKLLNALAKATRAVSVRSPLPCFTERHVSQSKYQDN